MATDSSKTTSNTPPDMSDIGAQVTSNLASADNVAAQRVQTLMWVHQARATQLSRTAATLKAQYGPNDPGVKSAEAAVAAANADAARVAVVHQQVSTPTPQVSAGGWILHGRVFNAQMQPVEGYTVFLVDAQKAYQQSYGFSYTDKSGYFQIDYAGPKAKEPTVGTPASTATAAASATPQLFVEVVNTKAQPVYLRTTAFQPVIGNATYQNHVLPAGEKPIGDPPPEIRAVALPKRKTRKKKA